MTAIDKYLNTFQDALLFLLPYIKRRAIHSGRLFALSRSGWRPGWSWWRSGWSWRRSRRSWRRSRWSGWRSRRSGWRTGGPGRWTGRPGRPRWMRRPIWTTTGKPREQEAKGISSGHVHSSLLHSMRQGCFGTRFTRSRDGERGGNKNDPANALYKRIRGIMRLVGVKSQDLEEIGSVNRFVR